MCNAQEASSSTKAEYDNERVACGTENKDNKRNDLYDVRGKGDFGMEHANAVCGMLFFLSSRVVNCNGNDNGLGRVCNVM